MGEGGSENPKCPCGKPEDHAGACERCSDPGPGGLPCVRIGGHEDPFHYDDRERGWMTMALSFEVIP